MLAGRLTNACIGESSSSWTYALTTTYSPCSNRIRSRWKQASERARSDLIAVEVVCMNRSPEHVWNRATAGAVSRRREKQRSARTYANATERSCLTSSNERILFASRCFRCGGGSPE